MPRLEGFKSPWCALQLDKHRIDGQIIGQQHGITNSQTFSREISLRLLRLETTEGGEMRLALGHIDDGVGALLAKLVPQQAASASCEHPECQQLNVDASERVNNQQGRIAVSG